MMIGFQATARQALEELAESREQFSGSAALDETGSIAESDKPLSELGNEVHSKLSIVSMPPTPRHDVTTFNDSSSSFDFKVCNLNIDSLTSFLTIHGFCDAMYMYIYILVSDKRINSTSTSISSSFDCIGW